MYLRSCGDTEHRIEKEASKISIKNKHGFNRVSSSTGFINFHFSNQFNLRVVQAEIGLLSAKIDTINNRNEHKIEEEFL